MYNIFQKKEFDTGLFLISLLPGIGLSVVSNIMYLLSQSIVWEKPKKKDEKVKYNAGYINDGDILPVTVIAYLLNVSNSM